MRKDSIFGECVRLLSFARPYRKHVAFAIISMVVYTSANGIQISLIKPLIDKLLLGNTSTVVSLPKIDIDQDVPSPKSTSPAKQFKKQVFGKFTFIKKVQQYATHSFTSIGVAMAIFAPIIFLSCYSQQYFRNLVMWAIVVDIRNKVCDHILPQPLSFFENRKSGDLLSRLTNDIAVTQSGLTVLFDDILLQPLKLICGLSLAFYFSWKLSLLTIIAFPVIFIPVLIMGKKIKKHGKGSLRHLADLTDALREMFAGIRIVKAFKMEAEESREIHEISNRFFMKRMKLVRAKAVNASTSEFVYTLGLAILIILGGYVIMSKKITPGELGGFITAIGFMVITTVKKLAKGYASLQESLAGVNRVFELFTIEPAIKDHPEAVTLKNIHKSISFNDVSFSYDNSADFILKDINLTIHKGEVVALVGKSGAGKSTLVNLIPRFYDPVKGSVEIDGIDIRKIKGEALLEHIAIVSQQTFLFNRSLRENILYGRKDASAEEIYAAAKSANIHDFIVGLPKGYDTVVGELGVKLSGGQRQRIAIARAILKNAPILLLDEATSSLDYESEKLVQDALNNLIAGKTTIIVAHRLSTILHCDRIIVMKNGCIVETGSHESLMSEEGEYKRVYQLHFNTLQT
ncbi:MAG: ABC transporter ATP-binding protein [Candidatus Brocadia sp.]|nr:ABC transporter ATP-binding protein [Candidatus Brocadia sp.]MDG6028053.1 ABC transporter ATP-binding protein [Candidatus Brocadia sp.]